MKDIIISNVCDFNAKNINDINSYDLIQYLDTGSITRNEISDLQTLSPKKDKIPSRAKRKVKQGTIIYSTVRPNQEHFGFIENPSNNLVVSTGFVTIDIKDSAIDPKFLYYLITQKNITDRLQSIAENSVSSYPSINPIDIGNLKFSIPDDLSEQRKIAEVISVLDKKVECNKRICAELEIIVKKLYEYWFVQFDFPDANGKPYRSSGGTMVYNDILKQEIPKGWDIKPLVDWIAKDKTGDWGKESPNGNHILRVNCIRGTDLNGLNGIGTVSSPTRYILQKNNAKLLTPFDFVIEISGGSPTQSTGRIANITSETINRFSDPIICSNFCKAISLHNNLYYFNFSYLWRSAYDNGILFGWEGKTSGIKNLLFDAFTQKYFVPTPPQDIAGKFFDFVSPIESNKQILCCENDSLEATKDWLLPMLMNGQVTVD